MRTYKKIIFTLIVFNMLLLFPYNVKGQTSETSVIINPNMISIYPYSFVNGTDEYILNNGMWSNLKVSVGNIRIDMDTGVTLMGVIKGRDSNGSEVRTYWYRVPFKMPFNIYTTLDKWKAIPLGTSAYKYTNALPFTKIARISDWRYLNDRVKAPWEYTYVNIPSWKLTTIRSVSGSIMYSGATNLQETLMRKYFRENFYYSGEVNFKMLINPTFGALQEIDLKDGVAYLNNTIVRLATCSNGDGQEYGDITSGNTYVKSNYPDSSDDTTKEKLTYDNELDYGDAESFVLSDPYYKLKSVQGVETSFWTEGGEIFAIEEGSSLNPINLETGEYLKEDPSTPTSNKTKWLIPYPVNKLYPKLTTYVTDYTIYTYEAVIDTNDEWGFFGDAGVRNSKHMINKYNGISAWRVDNYYIHDDLVFQLDLFTTYNIESKQTAIDEKDLEQPKDEVDDQYWLILLEKLMKIAEDTEHQDDFGDFLNKYGIYLVIILVAVILLIVVILLSKMGFKFSSGRGNVGSPTSSGTSIGGSNTFRNTIIIIIVLLIGYYLFSDSGTGGSSFSNILLYLVVGVICVTILMFLWKFKPKRERELTTRDKEIETLTKQIEELTKKFEKNNP